MKTILVITVVVAFFVAGYCIAYSRMQIKYDELYVKYLNQQAVNHTVSIWLKEKVRIICVENRLYYFNGAWRQLCLWDKQ